VLFWKKKENFIICLGFEGSDFFGQNKTLRSCWHEGLFSGSLTRQYFKKSLNSFENFFGEERVGGGEEGMR